MVLSVPANPYRCPPALTSVQPDRPLPEDAEAACQDHPADAKDTFSKQKLFEAAWAKLYPIC